MKTRYRIVQYLSQKQTSLTGYVVYQNFQKLPRCQPGTNISYSLHASFKNNNKGLFSPSINNIVTLNTTLYPYYPKPIVLRCPQIWSSGVHTSGPQVSTNQVPRSPQIKSKGLHTPDSLSQHTRFSGVHTSCPQVSTHQVHFK